VVWRGAGWPGGGARLLQGAGDTGEAVPKGNGRRLVAHAIDGRGSVKEGL
jgi:hypothetical protein